MDTLTSIFTDPRSHQTIHKLTKQPLYEPFLAICTGELESAIKCYQLFHSRELFFDVPSKYLINTLHLKTITPSLPSIPNLLTALHQSPQVSKQTTEILAELNIFEFLDQPVSWQIALSRLTIATYRTIALHLFPLWRLNNAQIASTLEEMIAVLAINKTSTHLFLASIPWLKDWGTEGFSPELSKLITNLPKVL